jgi:hypothetical protein
LTVDIQALREVFYSQRGATMRKAILPLSITLLLVSLATALPRQTPAPPKSADADHARRSLAVNLLRTINTAEYAYKSTHGNFVPWDALLVSEEFKAHGMRFTTRNQAQLAGAQFSQGPEILPGWDLRMTLINSGAGYEVQLEDSNDKSCHYAAATDERGVIRQSKTIDCSI